MARIAGIDIPRDKQIWVALQRIHGIGAVTSQKILAQAGVEWNVLSDDLTEDEVNRVREIIDKEYTVEGELRKEVDLNIKRLIETCARNIITKKKITVKRIFLSIFRTIK